MATSHSSRFGAGLLLVSLILGTGAGVGVEAFTQEASGAATTITVNDAGDFPVAANGAACLTDPEGDCNLRNAIAAFDNGSSDMTIDLPDSETVTNPADVYEVISSIGDLDIANATTGLTLTITFTGTTLGRDFGNVSAEQIGGDVPDTNVFDVESGVTADISGLNIENGEYSATQTDEDGAGIQNTGTLNLTDSNLIDNDANGDGDSGGGIAQTGPFASMTLTDDNITGNHATVDGGGVDVIAGGVTITGGTIGAYSEFGGNSAGDDGGGVALEGGEGSLSGVTIGGTVEGDGNTAGGDGGGVYVAEADPSFSGDTIEQNSAAGSDGGGGGGVYIVDGANTFTDETIIDNEATGSDGGGVYINDGINTFTGGSISDNIATDVDGGGGVYISDGTNAFTGATISGNEATGEDVDGGGVDIEDGTNTFGTSTTAGDTINDNEAYDGGGVYYDGGDSTSFFGSTVDGNAASDGAGGIYDDAGSPLTVSSSTISGNAALPDEDTNNLQGGGGGIVSQGCDPITLTNDTVADNSAPSEGGGYYGTECGFEGGPEHPAALNGHAEHPNAEPGATTTLTFDTFSGNSTGDPGGGGNIQLYDDDSTISLAQTIVADGIVATVPATNCEIDNVDSGGTGSITSAGYNLIDDNTCGTPGTGDIIGQSAQLGALANNGGPTETLLPASGSPAAAAVPASVCTGTGVSTDQRGDARGAGNGGTCTIGAVEVAQATPPPPPPPPPSYNPNGYRLVADEGGIFDFGLNFNGSLANNHLNAPIVGLANSPGPNGYVMVGSDGGVFALGGANFYGSLGGTAIPSPIAAIAAPTAETGYWLAAQNGKIYNFGSVPPLPAVQLPSGAHIVGMASDNSGQGAWLVDQLGDVYAEGDALYEGGLGGVHLNAPIVGIAAAASGQGYVLVASDGGVFNYKMGFYGSVPGSLKTGQSLVAPIVGIAVTHSGNGYWEVGADGGVFNYGDAPFLGSIYTAIPGEKLNGPIVGIQHLGSAPPA
jgi:hypothetical protein